MQFEFTELSDAERALQVEVREFLETTLPRGSFEPGLGMAGRKDPEFSQALAARGWVGMSLPREYGGGDRAAVERFVVAEELLRWGAPVGSPLGRRPPERAIDREGGDAGTAGAVPARHLPG